MHTGTPIELDWIMPIKDEMDNRSLYATEEQRWRAVVKRDENADGHFYYGVLTTGVFCRPGCASRQPKRENVRFFDDVNEALAAGLRPCKRCQPQSPVAEAHREAILAVCAWLDGAEDMPALREMAARAALSPYHFHRVFKKMIGVTPREYHRQVRLNRLRADLPVSNSVTDAVLDAGYGSGTPFYAADAATLGVNPARYRQGSPDVRVNYTLQPCHLGWALIAATHTGVCAIEFDDAPEPLEQRLRVQFPKADLKRIDQLEAGGDDFSAWVRLALDFIETPAGSLDLPLDVRGTAFQRRVWQALRQIPAGTQATYAQVAQRLDVPNAVRAVANACASNSIAVVIPCHRVVRSDGGLGGYRWGLKRKRALLEREQRLKE